jgi:hypothetical protein
MSDEPSDPNQRIARLMGVDTSKWGKDVYVCGKCGIVDANHSFTHSTYIARVRSIDYFSPDLPIGERLKMWEKLTEAQKARLIYIHCVEHKHVSALSRVGISAITFALSPEFPSTFLRVVEGKG